MSELAAKKGYTSHYNRSDVVKEEHVSGWVGWIGFAGFLMILSGIFHMISGLVGVFDQSFFLVSGEEGILLFQSVAAWGWANLLIGAIILLAGFSLFSGSMWSRIIAVLLAMLAATANLLSISLYPIWSVIMITLSVFVMYAVIVHGDDMREM